MLSVVAGARFDGLPTGLEVLDLAIELERWAA
jgi:hypothetical protein